MEDPITAVVAPFHETTNRKKRSHHRRSQSTDSTDSSKEGKTGKVRRKLHWTMKDLLVSTALMTIDSNSVGSGAEATCATDSTAHSIFSMPPGGSQMNPSSTSSKGERVEKPLLLDENNNLTATDVGQVDKESTHNTHKSLLGNLPLRHYVMPPAPAAKAARRKLIPRLPRSFLEHPKQSKASIKSPESLTGDKEVPDCPATPYTPVGAMSFSDDNSSTATTLTPISPMRLAFDNFQSPQFSLTNNEEDFVMMQSENETSQLEDSSLSTEGISLVLFPENGGQVPSPLTPSPQLHSPPVRRLVVDRPGQRPFRLERILSESHLDAEPKRDLGKKENKEQQQQPQAVSFQITTTTSNQLENEMKQKEPSGAVETKGNNNNNYNRRLSLASSKGPRNGSMRCLSSVPVDVDDVQFVEVEKNLHTLGEMADEHLDRMEYDEALDVLKEILRGNLEKHGYEHETVGLCLHNIGTVNMKRRSLDKAESSLLKAIDCRKLTLGDEHPDTAASWVQLGLVYFEKAQYDSALEVFQNALRIRRKVFGPRHLKVAKVLNNIGCCMKAQHINLEAIMAFEEGLQLQQEALESSAEEMSEDGFSQLSLAVASTFSNIGTVKLSLGLFEEALMALDEAYKIQTSILGKDAAETRETKDGIDFICKTREKRDLTEAIELADPDVNDRTALIPAMLNHCQPTEHVLRNMKVSPPALAPQTTRLHL